VSVPKVVVFAQCSSVGSSSLHNELKRERSPQATLRFHANNLKICTHCVVLIISRTLCCISRDAALRYMSTFLLLLFIFAPFIFELRTSMDAALLQPAVLLPFRCRYMYYCKYLTSIACAHHERRQPCYRWLLGGRKGERQMFRSTRRGTPSLKASRKHGDDHLTGNRGGASHDNRSLFHGTVMGTTASRNSSKSTVQY
jgi:hypothetical protein